MSSTTPAHKTVEVKEERKEAVNKSSPVPKGKKKVNPLAMLVADGNDYFDKCHAVPSCMFLFKKTRDDCSAARLKYMSSVATMIGYGLSDAS